MNLEKIISGALDAAKRFVKWLLPDSKQLLDLSLDIVNGIKDFDDNHPDIANLITSLIPGTVDDYIVAKIREYLPEVLTRLKWAEIEANKTPDEIVADAAKFIKTLLPEEQAMAYQGLWQLLSNKLTQDGVSMKDLQKIGQVYYESVYQK